MTARIVSLACTCALVGSAPSAAQGARPRAITLEDFYRFEAVGSPVASPDGRRAALTRTVTDEARNARRSEIWLVTTDGAHPPVRLTSPGTSSSAPQWSPDGALLAFSSRRDGGTEGDGIWFLGFDRPGEAFQIAGVGGRPIFSPDNRWIAFVKAVPPPPRPTEPLTDFERALRERFTGRAHEWIQYRFDGRGYLPDPTDPAVSPPQELHLVARAGGEPRQLTRLGLTVQDAAWSPDSRSLALVADAHQRDEYTYQRADLWIVDTAARIRRLTDDGYDHDSPTWSPDGKTLAFRRAKGLSMVIESREARGAPVDLYLMAAAGGPMRSLTDEWDLIPGEPTWSPDGRHLYFAAETGGDRHLFRVPAGGGSVEQITRGARRLSGVSYSLAHDRIVYAASDPTRPDEIFSAKADGSGELRLTRFNDRLLGELALSPAERLRYLSRDGTVIEGWLMLPRGDPGRGATYPLIVSIHGGPHGAYGTSFSFPFQLLAAQGYAVLYTNPRGSTGYGEDFLWATWGGWGDKDGEDVLAGVDDVLVRYPIDRARLGVSGYSYGGFLTNWLITQDRRFAAAVSGAGISNWVSDYATADIPRTKESEFFGPPWEARSGELLLKQSPVMHAKGVTTPTLFVHGEADYRVPVEQAEQMYLALRKQLVPARLVRYPGMSHGGWTPWNTVHRYYEELNWWSRYLKPPVP
jgi:dipeptidyl aminopeptidase/acylaminoacyl peptidase